MGGGLLRFGLLTLVLGSCGGYGPALRPREPQIHHTTAGEVRGPYVPEGTSFTVELIDEVKPGGGIFRATTRGPLQAPDGTVVVRRGAVVHGRVTPIHVPHGPRAAIDLTTIRTMEGDIPIAARRAGGEVAPDATALDFTMAPAAVGTSLALVLTEPLVPVGSTYR